MLSPSKIVVSERWLVVRKFVPFVEPVLSIVEGFVAKIFIHPFDQLRTGCVAPPLVDNSIAAILILVA